jgi:hypothetical protein
MKNRLSVISRGDEELGVLSGRGLGMINICRTKKRRSLLQRVIHAGKSRLCTVVESHRRSIAHRKKMHI